MPDLLIISNDLLLRYVGLSIPDVRLIEQIRDERLFAWYSQMLAIAPFYLYFDVGDGQSLPLFNDAAEFTLQSIPTSIDFDDGSAFETLFWWLRIVSLLLKEIAKPYLKFDEMSLSIVAVWDFLLVSYGTNFT